MFITFEGLDFSGKTTQAVRAVERLQDLAGAGEAPPVHFLREPGGTRISERIREMLLDKANLDMGELTELLLFSASRAQLVREIIRPALERGEIVVCDRYCDSTTAYQGYGRGIDLALVRAVNTAATGGTMPDLTLVIDIPVDEIARRKDRAGMAFDRMESAGRAFYERVRQGYRDLAAQEPRRFVIVDGTGSIDTIGQDVWRHLSCRLKIHQRERKRDS
ncbi:MAG TPA: dTMP kinase [Bacteroidota bacterium]